MKFYAVKKGRTPGVYRSWPAAKKQVEGFPGAEYKSFANITDAANYLNWNKQTQKKILSAGQDRLEEAIAKIKGHARNNNLKRKNSGSKNTGFFARVYTDGGTRNTGNYRGGHVRPTDKAAWAYQIKWQGREVHEAGGEIGATNNKMEQEALIQALKRLIKLGFNEKRLLFTLDSRYVLNPIRKGWLKAWKKRGWKKPSGKLANVSQWQEIDRLLARFPHASFVWTKGHAGNTGNEFVDHLLNRYMDERE